MSWLSDDNRVLRQWREDGDETPAREYRYTHEPRRLTLVIPPVAPSEPRLWALLEGWGGYVVTGAGLLAVLGVALGVRL